MAGHVALAGQSAFQFQVLAWLVHSTVKRGTLSEKKAHAGAVQRNAMGGSSTIGDSGPETPGEPGVKSEATAE